MYLTVAVVLFLSSIVLHEMGHALWMRRYGLTVTDFGIGIPVPGLTFSFMWGATRVRISPLVLGAFVKCDEATAPELTWKQQADIYAAGPLANLVFAAGCFIVAGLLSGFWPPFVIPVVAAAAVSLLFPRLVSRYAVPLASLAVLVLMAMTLMHKPDSMMGPAGMVQVLSLSKSLAMSVGLAGSLSMALGMMNLLPLFPLDAGKTWYYILRAMGLQRTALVYANGGTFVLFALIALAFYSDWARLRH